MHTNNAWRGCATIAALLALSLSGCATPSRSTAPLPPVAVAPPALPAPPQISAPLPQQSYLQSARQRILSWHNRLTGTPPTCDSCSTGGRDD